MICKRSVIDGDLCNILLFPYFLFFSGFNHALIIYSDFTHIATSNTTSDDVTNYVTHRIFNTDLLYFCAHFIVKTDKKSSLNGSF